MPTAQQNQLLGALFGGGQLFNMGAPDAGAMQPGQPDMIAAPGYPESPMASPGGPDRIPIFQQGGQSGSFFGVQENAPTSYAATPGFGNDGRLSPALQPRNPGLNLEALLGMSKKEFGKADPFQQSAFNQLFTTQEQLLGTLQNYGAGAAQAVEQGFTTQQNRLMGQLAQRGLMGSNAFTAPAASIERERQTTLNQLSDQLLGRKFDVMGGFGKSIADLAAGIGGVNQQAKLQQKMAQQAQDAKGIISKTTPYTGDPVRRAVGQAMLGSGVTSGLRR